MRRITILLIAGIVALGLVAFTMTYTVRFTEAAVKTTFGKASDASVTRDPGLKFKWPYPIQSVTKYDTRGRVLSSRLEQVQTGDSKPVTVETFCTWRVADPLKFFQRFSNAGEREEDHYKEAQTLLDSSLRSGMSELSRYSIDDLFTRDPAASKFSALEENIKQKIIAASESGMSLADSGIEVVFVGIGQIKLPEQTTQEVFKSMTEDRAQIVKKLESEGASVAKGITSKAEADAARIMAFAELLASTKRRLGDAEASEWIAKMNEQQDLAVFLRNLDLLKSTLGTRLTIVLPVSDFGLGVMDPSRLGSLRPGELPGQTVAARDDLLREVRALNRQLADLAGDGAPFRERGRLPTDEQLEALREQAESLLRRLSELSAAAPGGEPLRVADDPAARTGGER